MLVSRVKTKWSRNSDIESFVMRKGVLTSDLQNFVLLSLYPLLSDWLVKFLVTWRLKVIAVFLSLLCLLILNNLELPLQVLDVDSILDKLWPSSIGQKVKYFLQIQVLFSLRIHSYECFFEGLFLDISISFRTDIHSLDSLVPWIFAQILQELFFPHEVLSKFWSFVEDLFDYFQDLLRDDIDIRRVEFSSKDELCDKSILLWCYSSFVVAEEFLELVECPIWLIYSFLIFNLIKQSIQRYRLVDVHNFDDFNLSKPSLLCFFPDLLC